MTEQALTRHDLEAKIIKRSWENEGFRKEFTGDPAGTAAKYLNVPADKLPKIIVHEEPAGTWYIVLPPQPANASELSERELESVAGASITNYTYELTYVAVSAAAAAVVGGGTAAASAFLDEKIGW
jgi:hypothetical protein